MRTFLVCTALVLAQACTEQRAPVQMGGTTAAGNGGTGGWGGGGGAGGAGDMAATPLDASVAGAGGGAPAPDASAGAGGGAPDAMVEPDASALDASVDAGMAIDDDRCDVAALDPANPPRTLEITGNLGTHDPTLIEHDGTFYLWQTGPRLPGKTSTDLEDWSGAPSALGAANPAWVNAQVPGATDLWAPDLSYFGGAFHLYYSASTFGSNHSCIGHATRASLSSGSWGDHGSVVCSETGDDHNAIDPNVIVDTEATPWLSFGSFWDGIKAVRLNDDGTRAGTRSTRSHRAAAARSRRRSSCAAAATTTCSCRSAAAATAHRARTTSGSAARPKCSGRT